MEDLDLAETIKKNIEDRRELIKNTLMNGMLKDIEHYKYLQGELSALYYITNELIYWHTTFNRIFFIYHS